MNDLIRQWRHVFKLDPDKEIGDEALERVCMSGSDAVIVGGTTGVTYDNTVDLLARIRRYAIPCALEVSNRKAVAPGFDLYLIPFVLNSTEREWLIGHHHQALQEYGSFMPWESVAAEGYVITNPHSAAARLCNAITDVGEDGMAAYARLADRLFRFPVLYIENSGAFGDMQAVQTVKAALTGARLFYGGGIDGPDKAAAAARAAHTIVVGNAIYDDLPSALQTVAAVKASMAN